MILLLKENYKDKKLLAGLNCYGIELSTNDDNFEKYFKHPAILVPTNEKYYFKESDIEAHLRRYRIEPDNLKYYHDITKLYVLIILSYHIKSTGNFVSKGDVNYEIIRINNLFGEINNIDEIFIPRGISSDCVIGKLLQDNNFDYHILFKNFNYFITMYLINNEIQNYEDEEGKEGDKLFDVEIDKFIDYFKNLDKSNAEKMKRIVELLYDIGPYKLSLPTTKSNLMFIEEIIKVLGIDKFKIRNKTIDEIITSQDDDIKNFYREIKTNCKFVFHNYSNFYMNCNSLKISPDNSVELRYMNDYVHGEIITSPLFELGIFNDLLKVYIEPLFKLL